MIYSATSYITSYRLQWDIHERRIIIIYSVTSFIPSSRLQWAIHEWIPYLPYFNMVDSVTYFTPRFPQVKSLMILLRLSFHFTVLQCDSISLTFLFTYTFYSMGNRTSNPVHNVPLTTTLQILSMECYTACNPSFHLFLCYSAPPMFSGWFTVCLSLKPPPRSLRV